MAASTTLLCALSLWLLVCRISLSGAQDVTKNVRQVFGNDVFKDSADSSWYGKVTIPHFGVAPGSFPCTARIKNDDVSSSVMQYMVALTTHSDPLSPTGGYAWLDNAIYDEGTEVLFENKPGADVRGLHRISCRDENRAPDAVVTLQPATLDRTFEKKTVVILGPVLWSYGFYHFFADSIFQLIQLPDHVLANATIVLGAMQPKWQKFLDYLGYGHLPILHPDSSRRYVFGRAYLPSGASCGYPILGRVDHLYARFRKYLASHPLAMPVKLTKPLTLMISRAGASRHLSNWDTLVQHMRTVYGNEQDIVEHTSAHSPEDSIALFHAADTIIGLHGAGLTQIFFARSGVRVVEISPAPMYSPSRPINYCYPLQACLRRQQYWLQPVAGSSQGFHAALNVEEFVNVFMKKVYATPSMAML